ncbi:PREDICTED: nuclear envelope pore membrane protein POM 121-like [Elephantulus edwardii]|uniref:nuclear envelope pore membrane protein POM 121-like n=1 Tax=Elephantulus edwardii TaxID=28737 RepID=UPI0003F0D08C|nr:PREDICTED: nuclear envelope pore membrane protein POM 121-like [Elephantulus edwardii]
MVPLAVPQSDHQEKPGVSAYSHKMFSASVARKMAPTEEKFTLRWALKQVILYIWSSLSGHLLCPYVKNTPMKGFKESTKLSAQEEEDVKVLGDIEEKPLKQEEDLIAIKRPGTDASEHAQSAFRPLVVNGVLSSFAPRPGPLNSCSNRSEGSLINTPQVSFMPICSKRNAITSSYSSTRGLLLLQRRVPARSSGSHILNSQVPAKKVNEEDHQISCSASVIPEERLQEEKSLDTTPQQKQQFEKSALTRDRSRPCKRKIPLLLPSKRGGPLILPPAPELGYQITIEDFDLEKKAAINYINKILKEPVSALLAVLAFIHLPGSSAPASSSSHLFHQWSRGPPRTPTSSSTKTTSVHAPAATEATSVSTTTTSEHSTWTTTVHEATSAATHATRATSAAVTTQRQTDGGDDDDDDKVEPQDPHKPV